MRSLASVCLFLIPAFSQTSGQSQVSTYTFDANGRRVLDNQRVAAPGATEQRTPNLNGRVAPLEKIEERILSEDSNGKVVERVTRGFDASGAPLPPRKVVTTTQKKPDGSQVLLTQVYEGNVNGSFALTERTNAIQREENGRVITQTEIARPTLNGSVETVEKKLATLTKSGDKSSQDTVTYRKDTSGSFYTAAREVKETETRGATTFENTANYASMDHGQLQFVGQVVSESTKRGDGSESTQVSLYGVASPGRPASGQPVLREQQLIEKTVSSAGSTESFSIRRPAVDGSGALGPTVKISEKVCTGSCQ